MMLLCGQQEECPWGHYCDGFEGEDGKMSDPCPNAPARVPHVKVQCTCCGDDLWVPIGGNNPHPACRACRDWAMGR